MVVAAEEPPPALRQAASLRATGPALELRLTERSALAGWRTRLVGRDALDGEGPDRALDALCKEPRAPELWSGQGVASSKVAFLFTGQGVSGGWGVGFLCPGVREALG